MRWSVPFTWRTLCDISTVLHRTVQLKLRLLASGERSILSNRLLWCRCHSVVCLFVCWSVSIWLDSKVLRIYCVILLLSLWNCKKINNPENLRHGKTLINEQTQKMRTMDTLTMLTGRRYGRDLMSRKVLIWQLWEMKLTMATLNAVIKVVHGLHLPFWPNCGITSNQNIWKLVVMSRKYA